MNTKPRNKAYLWEFMTVKEMRVALKKTKTVILPIGVIEQHGYHLPLNTDVYNAYELARLASEKTGCLVAPPFTYTFSGGTLPGTININPQVVSLLIIEACRSFVMQGLKNIVVLLGHGGSENQKATEEAVDMFLRQNPDLKVNVALLPFTELSSTVKKAFKDKDYHAGYMETSLMLYWHPELVRQDEVTTDKRPILNMLRQDPDNYQVRRKAISNKYVYPAITQHPGIKVGVMGDPYKASARFGEKVVKECLKNIIKLIKDMERKLGKVSRHY